MINFASLFNQFNKSGGNSSLNDLLEQEDITLDRLLDEESFINQFKSGNTKVINFMNYHRFEQLINFIVEVGPADDKKRGYKFPLTTSELLVSDNTKISEYLLPDDKLIITNTVVSQKEIDVEVEVDEDDEEEIKPTSSEDKELSEESPIKVEKQSEEIITQTSVQKSNDSSQKLEEKEPNEAQINKQEQFGDFQEPKQIKKKKIIMKQVERTENVIETEVPALINKLFSYFEGEVNYTLAGYVCKVLTTLFNRKAQKLLGFILQKEKQQKLVNHIESRSVVEFILKVVTYESKDFLEQRSQLVKLLIERLSHNLEVHVISNLSACLCEILDKITISSKTTNPIKEITTLHICNQPHLIDILISNVISPQENISVYSSPVLLSCLINLPNQIYPHVLEILNQQLENFITKGVQKINVEKRERKTFGLGRLKIIEIFGNLLKLGILNSRKIFSVNKQFIPVLLSLCRNYELNNMLHNEVYKIIEMYLLEDSEPAFLESLLDGDTLLNFIVEETEQDRKIRAGTGSTKFRKGFIVHIVNICKIIKERHNQNQNLNTLFQRKQFETVLESLIDKEIASYNKNLAGFTMKKGFKTEILFQKDEIIATHAKFLSHTPPSTYEIDQNDPRQNPDLMDQLRHQLEKSCDRDTNQPKSEEPEVHPDDFHKHHEAEAKRTQKETEHLMYEPGHEQNYFKMHMDYDVEALMEDI